MFLGEVMMRAVIDGDRVRIYWNDGRLFFILYHVSRIARDFANSELSELERIIYEAVFRDCVIPIPKKLKTKVAKQLMEIQLDKGTRGGKH
jgi:hypothetical protein